MPKKNIAVLSIAMITVLMFVFSAVTICAADQKEIVIKITAKKIRILA